MEWPYTFAELQEAVNKKFGMDAEITSINLVRRTISEKPKVNAIRKNDWDSVLVLVKNESSKEPQLLVLDNTTKVNT